MAGAMAWQRKVGSGARFGMTMLDWVCKSRIIQHLAAISSTWEFRAFEYPSLVHTQLPDSLSNKSLATDFFPIRLVSKPTDMGISVELNTPLAAALNDVVQPKLVEVGWSSGGGDDSALAEYVILMLVNGKTQEQIAAELSNDLLSLGPEDTEAAEFSKWLFQQVELLDKQLNGGPSEPEQPEAAPQAIPSFSEGAATGHSTSGQDAEMGDGFGPRSDGTIPTGPRTMNNYKQNGRGRILGQISRAMERPNDSVLHRVRNQQGTERINAHRDLPKGPRAGQGRGGRAHMGRQMNQGLGMGGGPTGMNNRLQNMPHQQPTMSMTPEQQMQIMAMFEEQARMMSQFMPGIVPPAINPAFQNGPPQQQGRSLFERAEFQSGRNQHQAYPNGNTGPRPAQEGQTDIEMGGEVHPTGESTEREPPGPDTICRFNLRCTNKDCIYAHQSPAAPEGTAIDVNDNCPFGAACKNRKCVGRHPSPAQKAIHQAEEICKYFPYCSNPRCQFKHPDMPLCRNGADCSTTGCKFTHIQVACKFNPCLNRSCPYKHTEGQRGVFGDKVWVAENATAVGEGSTEKPHVSQRKFIADENEEEELIKPGSDSSNEFGLLT
ncbi:hypothetical protein FQN57_000560 [Myotisia sp. PD_48]|nr:hypothetical protein FQN57_000560 [Myotisia sp. PD_48]